MKKDIFNVDNFNIIEDEENYYFFRAFNNADNKDIENSVITSSDGFTRIRTDRERWEEGNRKAKYEADSKISLEQVYDHIKMRYRKDTNCISLSSNANVSIVYGRGNYADKYAIVKIPKKEMGQKVINAGQYMLREIESKVNNAVSELDEALDKEIIEQLEKVDSVNSLQEINDIMQKLYSKVKIEEEKRYRGKKVDFETKISVLSRGSSYQALNEEQTLEKNRIIAKLTILELKKKIEPLIPHTKTNSRLIGTIGNAVASSEQIYYGAIPGEIITEVPKEIMDIFALLQQQDKNNPIAKKIERELLGYINERYHIEKDEAKVVFTNGIESIDLKSLEESFIFRDDEPSRDTTIENMYEITGGRVSYEQATSLVKKIFYLSKSKARAREYSEILNKITKNNPEYQEIIDKISENGFEIEPEIITRLSYKGYKLSEAVNLDLKKQEIELVEHIKTLSNDELTDILIKGGMSDINEMISRHFSDVEKLEQIDKNTYYANAIIDSYNWEKVGISFTDIEKKEFLKRLQTRDCIELYTKLKENGAEEKDIPISILNIVTKEKFANVFEHGNLQESLQELKQDVSIEQIERFLGYYDIPNTGITLKDYQIRAIENVDKLFEEKKFASVILPTGAGKSYVALDQLLKHKDEPMVYFAPSNEILTQIKDKIVNSIHGKEGTLGKSVDEIVKDVFPNLTFETYQSLLTKTPEELKQSKYKYMILDELHRTGANEWEKKLNKLLESQDEDIKVLGITATPQRDRGGKDMAYETALKLGYTEEEVKNEKHIAMKMDLIDAIRAGIVVNPLLVSCEYNLIQDGTLDNLLQKIETIKYEEKRKELENKYENLRRKLEGAKGIPELLENAITKRDGKYIVFIPVMDNDIELEDEDGNKIGKKNAKEKIEESKKQIEKWLENIDEEPEFYSMLGEYGDKKNARELREFEKSDSNHIKVMVVINKLNEGIHIDGIDGIIWKRALDEDSKILLLQQLGRCIYAIDDDTPKARPIVIDLPNNMLKIDLHKEINTCTPKDDLTLLDDIVYWVHKHNERLPDINSTSREEKRKAVTLKRIQTKYEKYLEEFEEELEQSDIEKIQQIISKGEEIELWNEILPEKEIQKGEFDIDINLGTFELKGQLKELYELEKEVDEKELKSAVTETLKIARILKESGVDLSKIQTVKQGKQILLNEIEQEGVDIQKIIKEKGLDKNFKFGQRVHVLRGTYKGTIKCSITEEQKREAKELGLVELEKESVFTETLRIARILKENGVDLRKIQLIRKGKKILLNEIEQEGVDIQKVIEENKLDEDFNFGKRVANLKRAYKGTIISAITEEEKRETEELGLIELEKESVIVETLRMARVLKENGVDLRKIQLIKKGKKILLNEIEQEGVDINKIIEENGLDKNFKFGQRVYVLRSAHKGNNYYLMTEEEKRETEELGLIELEKVSAVAETLKIAKILKENGVELRKIQLVKKGKKILLNEIEQEGVDIQKIIEENDLDGDFNFGKRVATIRSVYKGIGTTVITEEEKVEAEKLGLVELEPESVVAETLRIASVLKQNGVDLGKTKLIKKGKEILLKEIMQEGIDIQKIIEENDLDKNFKFGQRVASVRRAYRGNNRLPITEEEKILAEKLELIKTKINSQDIGQATFDVDIAKCDEAHETLSRDMLDIKNKNIGEIK